MEVVKEPKKTVKLRIYKGREILMKADLKTVQNENQIVTLTPYDTEWETHKANLKKFGICKVEIEAYYEDEVLKDAPQELKEEVEGILKAEKVTVSAQDQRISDLEKSNAELREKLEQFMANGNGGGEQKAGKKKEEDQKPEGDEKEAEARKAELKEAKAKYAKLFNKNPSPAWTVAIINQKIAEKESEGPK